MAASEVPLVLVDESYRCVGDGQISLLACVLVHPSQQEDLRSALRAPAGRPSRRLHWRDEKRPQRLTICASIAAARVLSTTWLSPLPSPRHQKRASRRLLEAALYDLGQVPVEEVIIEPRHDDPPRPADGGAAAVVAGCGGGRRGRRPLR